jgi:16S rRNA (guanine966-N2)-methyltransferase
MRIVAGSLRGRRLRAPDGLDTRPTTDRVREAVFNSLVSMDLIADAEVVDLFAGTGALGIEALSRGAARCRFVEKDREALRILRANLTDLGLERSSVVLATDVMAAAASLGPCDLVLADPPYQFDAWPELLGTLQAGFVVAESGRSLSDLPRGWELVREKRYGRTVVSFLRPLHEVP